MKGKYNFSAKHWMTIFICFVLAFLANVVTSDSENVLFERLRDVNSLDYPTLLTIATIAGCISILGNLIWGRLCAKIGPKFVILAALVVAAGFLFLYGTATNYVAFAIGLVGTICSGQCLSFIGGSAVIANWFPKKKGLAMGFVAMGPPVASVSMVLGFTFLLDRVGLRTGVLVICIILLLVAVLCLFCLHNTPEQVGKYPDNIPPEAEAEAVKEIEEAKVPLSYLFKQKNFWLIIAIIGICSLSQTGLMAQWLSRYEGSSFTKVEAGLLMTISAVVGIFGSMVVGFLENKLGTKKSYMVLAIWFAAAFVLNFTNIRALVYVSVVMFGLVISLLQIYMPAFEISAFGREGFRQANAIVFPVISLCGQLAFVIIAIFKTFFNEIRFVYLLFAGLLVLSAILSMFLKFKDNE